MDIENTSDENKMDQPQQQSPPRRQKGGLITMPFIIANEALQNLASFGLMPNMILYLMGDYHIGIAQGTNILLFWSAANNFLPLIGAFVCDSYLGRFLTIGFCSISTLLGMVLLWLTTMIPQARPPPCNQFKEKCKSPSSPQFAMLISCFALMSIGAAGIKPCSLAFGADQLDKRNSPGNKSERSLETYFSWYYATSAISVIIAVTGIVYIQDHAGWKVGFGVPMILMFFSAVFFFLASRFYIKQKATTSLFTGLSQVVVASYKNRKLGFPSQNSNLGYHQKKGSGISQPTDKLRFLNKACIIQNPQDITPDGQASSPWTLCTVDQVEALKSLIRVMPLWSTTILTSLNLSQGSFQVLQAKSMDRHIFPGFQFPAGSFIMFTIIGAVVWIAVYDRAIIPLASQIRGKKVKVGVKTRMGLGLFLAFIAMVTSAIVEHVRRKKAIESGYLNSPGGVVAMSGMWLVPQHFVNGMAEALIVVGQTEFFYSELPKSMSSIALALAGLGSAVGSLLASSTLATVDNLTKKGGRESWLSNNINRGHFESYYWLLAIMSSINFLYFLLCSWAYGPCSDEGFFRVGDEIKDLNEEELNKIGNRDRNGGEDQEV